MRDAPTPTAEQLDALAVPTAEDVDRAARFWKRNVSAARASLRGLLDATTEGNVGRATGPIPDESA